MPLPPPPPGPLPPPPPEGQPLGLSAAIITGGSSVGSGGGSCNPSGNGSWNSGGNPGSASPNPGSASPNPGSASPNPGSASPSPGSASPSPSASGSSNTSGSSSSSNSGQKPAFDKLWETKNPLNYVYNSTPKDDPPEVPKSNLYVVNTEIDAPYKVTLKFTFPSGERPKKWLCAIYLGPDKVPGSDTRFKTSGEADIEFAHYPPTITPEHRSYLIKYGKDINNDGVLDPSVAKVLIIPQAEAQALLVCYNTSSYFTAINVVNSGAEYGGYFFNKPAAANLLRIFRDGNTSGMALGYEPMNSQIIPFNCFTSEFSEWLTHNAGAPFAPNGDVDLTEYTWGKDSPYGQLANESPQLDYYQSEYWLNSVLFPLIAAWSSQPIGHEAWVPSSTGWYEVITPTNPQTATLDGFNPDINASFGRVRIMVYQARYYVKKTGSSDLEVLGYTTQGYFTDLYDFNILTYFPADEAAKVQLGYGNGNKGVSMGRIYREKFFWRKEVTP